MLRVVCWALAALALVAGCASGCFVDSAESLTACVRKILESSRPALKAKFDPLQLPSMSGGGNVNWALENIEVHGLSDFKIQRLSVKPESLIRIAINIELAWPRIAATMNGKVSGCVRFLWMKHCATVRAKPEIEVVNPSGSVSTNLELSGVAGRRTVAPRKTKITINLPGIKIKPNIKGFIGFLVRLFGNPTRYVSRLAENFWKMNKEKVEKILRIQVDKLINKHFTNKLTKVLKGLKG